uniref:Putative reverse transcriptase, intron maturase and HNH endonuclease n=1 Tax=Bracteacoccus giganteus TaxID=50039 RepID=A0A0S2LQ72_9CHLO|nr:putative reverse transcriptase, intron maturase and HNH endonuclease [Bracteacoccus giganteus]ALO63563.1 putative reverse transcriptase, intron maturase and HNH endonuclease [Bracteacoccus giganteus]
MVKSKSQKGKYFSKNRGENQKHTKKKFTREKFDIGIDMKEAQLWLLNQQEEIARAKRAGELSKAEQIASALVKNEKAQAVAVQIVATNTGARSPGLSKAKFCTNEDYLNMVDKLSEIVNDPNGYKAIPLDRLYIAKKDGRKRPLSIPSYTDRCLQALYKLALEPIAEEMSDLSSYGFRPIRSTSWAVGRVLNLLANSLANYSFVVEIDILGCFDNIDHTFLMQFVPVIPKKILWEWLSCGYVERDDNKEVHETLRGVPQGGILSPLLSNLTLDGLEDHIRKRIAESPSKSKGAGFCRYADDMVCFTTTRENADTAVEAIKEFLVARGLEIKEAKSRITNVNSESFEFLGYKFSKVYRHNRKRKSAHISIPLSAIRRFKSKVRSLTKARSKKMLHTIINEVNMIIRGWAGYYKYSHDSFYVFKSLRHWLWVQIYNCAFSITKHRFDKANMGKIHEEVKNKFFSKYENFESWPVVYDEKGIPHPLFDILKVSFVVPTFSNSARNAYITEDREILDRVTLRMKPTWRDVVMDKWLGCCGLCRKRLDINYVPYELHHILPRRFGGKDQPSNIVPLCKSPCHNQVSSAISSKDVENILQFMALGILEVPPDFIEKLISDSNK